MGTDAMALNETGLQETALQEAALKEIAQQFAAGGEVDAIAPLGNGNINSTYLITLTDSAQPKKFVLQRLNAQVFPQPELVIHNMSVLCEYLRDSAKALPRRWETPQIMPTQQGNNFWRDGDGEYWRAISFIEDSQVLEKVEDVRHAKEVGYGLGMFHSLISALNTDKLTDTLPGFHITPSYLAGYERVLAERSDIIGSDMTGSGTTGDRREHKAEIDYCLAFIEARKDWAHVLEKAQAEGHLHLRPIHGDPKVNNILLSSSGEAISLIDLDTLKPGLVHYDIGDCLRSGCNRLGEETESWQQVTFDTTLAKAMLQGYLSLASDFLTEQDYDYLYDAIRLIAFELGLRFFTDYLAGDVYFRVKHPTHNLTRALVQFKLTESIEQQEETLMAIIQKLR